MTLPFFFKLFILFWSFPHSSVSEESACSAGDRDSIPGSGKSPREGNGNPLQYSSLENPMDRGGWQATAPGVARVRHDSATKPPPPPQQQLEKSQSSSEDSAQPKITQNKMKF